MSATDTDLHSVPASWRWVTIGDLGKVVAGGTPSTSEPAYFGGDIPWLTPADLSGYDEKFIQNGSRCITQKGMENSSAVLMPAGTILFSSRAPVGYTVIATNPVTTNQGFKNLIPCESVFNEYVYHYLKGNKPLAESYGSGTTFIEVSGKNFCRIPLPLPPLNEQKRIVAKIEELFSDLDAGVAELVKAKAQIKRYRQSVLKAAFNGSLTAEWHRRHREKASSSLPLSSCIGSIEQGWSPKCERAARVSGEEWAVIKTTAVQPLCFVEQENKSLPSHLKPRAHLQVRSGDILVTRAGPRNRVGISCLVRQDAERLMVCDKVYRLQCVPSIVSPDYLMFALNAPQSVELLNTLKTGISDSGVNLTQSRFLEMTIPIPSVAEQRQIVDDIESRFSIADKSEQIIDQSLQQAKRLRQSILKRAFEGRLVPQDPKDEPADKLLARIKAEKAKLEPTKRCRRSPASKEP